MEFGGQMLVNAAGALALLHTSLVLRALRTLQCFEAVQRANADPGKWEKRGSLGVVVSSHLGHKMHRSPKG